MICHSCHSEIPDGAKFCPECGKPIKSDSAQKSADKKSASGSDIQTDLKNMVKSGSEALSKMGGKLRVKTADTLQKASDKLKSYDDSHNTEH